MKLLEWFAFGGRPRRGRADPSDLSRRDFFARVVGRETTAAPKPRPRRQASAERNVLNVFFVEEFTGKVAGDLLGRLRPGLDLELRRERDAPGRISMLFGEEMVGYVSAEIAPIVSRMMDDADPPICRIRSVDPHGPASRVIEIELLLFEL